MEEKEFAELLKACDNPALKTLLEVGYRQGLRRSELVNLRWAAVDLAREILHAVNVVEAGELTKSCKNRSLPRHPAVHAALSELKAAAAKRIEDGALSKTLAVGRAWLWWSGTMRATWPPRTVRRWLRL